MKRIVFIFLLSTIASFSQNLEERLSVYAEEKDWRANKNIEKNFSTIIRLNLEDESSSFFIFVGEVKENGRHQTETRELKFEGNIGHQVTYLRNIHPIWLTDLEFRAVTYREQNYASLFSLNGPEGVGSGVTLILEDEGKFFFLEFHFYHKDRELAYRTVKEILEPDAVVNASAAASKSENHLHD